MRYHVEAIKILEKLQRKLDANGCGFTYRAVEVAATIDGLMREIIKQGNPNAAPLGSMWD